ncbi:MAG: methylaspartate mutase, partial [Nitrospirota bacterium]
PRRIQSMLMMVDAYEPLGFTMLSVDSIFMMPHLGVLSTINEKAATDVFVRDCMVYLGTCVAPIGQLKDGERLADYEVTFPDGSVVKDQLKMGELRLFPLGLNQKAKLTMQPAKTVNLGQGVGAPVSRDVQGGVVGLLLDGRGRPLQLPSDEPARVAALTKWFNAVDLYPKGS